MEPQWKPTESNAWGQADAQGRPGAWTPPAGPAQETAQPGIAPEWIGYDGSGDPFGDMGEAPELRNERSRDLYEKRGRFWQTAGGARKKQKRAASSKPRARTGHHAVATFIAIVAVLVVVAVLTLSALFRLDSITVTGNGTISAEEVIRLSGLKKGMNTLMLDAPTAAKGIESNRYLKFVSLKRVNRNSVTINVREREPVAAVRYNGLVLTIDKRGMVLEESQESEVLPENLVDVVGLDLRRSERGRTVISNSPERLTFFTGTIIELKAMKLLDRVKELDLTDMDNLYLVTKDGFAVYLGTSENIHRKLRALSLTLDELSSRGITEGTVDVSTPEQTIYIP